MSYSVSLSKLLEDIGAEEGSKITVESEGRTHTGTLMPHHDFSDGDVVVIKLASGYNIGIRIFEESVVKVLGPPRLHPQKEARAEHKKGLPNIVLISTGGTIASSIDYRTGAVRPALSSLELINAVPGLSGSANFTSKTPFSVLSENMNAYRWKVLADMVAEEINNGADAVIITHGTDTMGYTAAALSFMLRDIPKPVVLVGAQRSPDRPSSDAPSNLTAAVRFCINGKTAGVFVVMHHTLEDDLFAVHVGTRVRKMHTSKRDAFKSVNTSPFAIINEKGDIRFIMEGRKITSGKVAPKTKMERLTVLLQYYPGMDPLLFDDVMMKSKGIVMSGTGLGHVGADMIPLIKKACDNGSVVVVTSQCLGGTANLNIYDTGRDMLSAGAISVHDMLPETAYVKLMWALANSDGAEEAKALMATPLADEMSDRRAVDG
jgi:glutamyl-tRNA(Gln) amidotransferase subunit D